MTTTLALPVPGSLSTGVLSVTQSLAATSVASTSRLFILALEMLSLHPKEEVWKMRTRSNNPTRVNGLISTTMRKRTLTISRWKSSRQSLAKRSLRCLRIMKVRSSSFSRTLDFSAFLTHSHQLLPHVINLMFGRLLLAFNQEKIDSTLTDQNEVKN